MLSSLSFVIADKILKTVISVITNDTMTIICLTNYTTPNHNKQIDPLKTQGI